MRLCWGQVMFDTWFVVVVLGVVGESESEMMML